MGNVQEQARRIADIHVLWKQNSIVEEMILNGKIDEDELYDLCEAEVLEWWLVSPWLAERLRDYGEVVIDAMDCHWWGRQTSGQAIYMDAVVWKIAEE